MGEVVTFYSYRGGVGRTMALAYTASLLAEWGYKTLVIDWDLGAPGIESYFKNYIDIKKVTQQIGLADLLYATGGAPLDAPVEANGRAPNGNGNGARGRRGGGFNKQPPWRWPDIVVPVGYVDGRGNLDLLTAGRRDEQFHERVRAFDVQGFYRRGGGHILEQWREYWKETYDFVLIDCQAGVTDLGAICNVQMADILVLMLSTAQHGIDNAVRVARRATAARAKLPLDRLHLLTLPVLGRVDDEHVNEEIRDEWLKEVGRKVSEFYDDWLPTFFSKTRMLSLTKIPYHRPSRMEEQLAFVHWRGEIGRVFENIAALLARELDDLHELHKNRAAYVAKANRLPSAKRNGRGVFSPQETRQRHELWLDTDGREGAQGDFSMRKLYEVDFSRAQLERALFVGTDMSKVVLSGANLRGADLTDAVLSDVKLDHANLTRASLSGAKLHEVDGFEARLVRADLRGADLSGSQFASANFRHANLLGSKLIKTDMSGARFVEANLSKVDFEGAQMLNADLSSATIIEPFNWTLPQFGGANLSGATVSEDISKELSGGEGLQGARRHAVRFQIYLFGLLAASAYVIFVALFETADAALLKNDGLGGTGGWMPARAFFILAPAVLLALYFLLHLSLYKLHARVAALPETYPGGRTSGEEVTNAYMRAALQPDGARPPRLWHTAVVFLARWFAPATLFLVWLRCLPLRDRTLTSVQLLLMVTSVFAAALLSRWRDAPAGGTVGAND
ncbi:MAG TPA: pentapeptide repeat-containing protein [Pyrinomonadaceae bacterium]|jgi:uncharacterized protein YjbI with pentapeptide repeats/cellulose biosynthesis protein BcsQ